MKISCVCFLLLLLLLIAFSQVFFICFALLRRPPSTFMRVLVLVRLRVCVCVNVVLVWQKDFSRFRN